MPILPIGWVEYGVARGAPPDGLPVRRVTASPTDSEAENVRVQPVYFSGACVGGQ